MNTSIIIPVHDRWDLTRACLDSVFAHTRGSFEVIVVDDASTDDTPRGLASYPVKVLRNEQRQSFSCNNNRAVRVAEGRTVCLLNNDTLVTAGWLEGLLDLLDREPDVGVVGNKHLFPGTGLLHHCGMAVTHDDRPLHLHPHADPALPSVNYQRDLDMVSFACCLIPKEWYLALGGLDEAFRNGFEDCDFCLRTRAAGRRVVYTPASTIYHYGQQSPGRTDTDAANAATFDEKWGGRMRRELEQITWQDRRHDAEVVRTSHTTVAGDSGIHLAIDLSRGTAITWAVAELAVALADMGRRVSIPRVVLTPSLEPRLRKRLQSLMSDTPCSTWHVRFNHYWPHLLRQPVCGAVNAEFFVTNYRFRGETAPLDMWSRCLTTNGVRKLALSGFCRDSLGDIGVPAAQCDVVPPGYAPEIDELFAEPRPAPQRAIRRVLVVTNSHDLERYGTDILIPAIARAFPPDAPVEIHIKDYGSGSGSRRLRDLVAAHPDLPPVTWHETFLSKPDLLRLYGEMDLLVCPFRGEGYAMKIVDAMAIGLPVMMPAFGGPLDYAPPGGFLDLPFAEVPVGKCYDTEHFLVGPGAWWCEVDADALAAALAGYLRDPSAAEAAGRIAREHVFGRFTWRHAAERMAAALDRWHAERERAVCRRRRPATVPTSVIIPTKNRPHELALTLAGYAAQTDRDFEIVLVNDHGDRDAVQTVAAPFADRLRLRLADNTGRPGPAAARNLGIELAEGQMLLVTGDDIVPTPTLVERHRAGHRRYPAREAAFVGFIDWHPDVARDWLHRHIVGAGGQQFNFSGMAPGAVVPCDRFFTANISWKRGFTADLEQVFAEGFCLAAFEDIELGHRLSLRGLRLRYLHDAVGLHLHHMTPRSFLARMRSVGAMCTTFAGMTPDFMPEEHLAVYDELERHRRHRATTTPPARLQPAAAVLEPFIVQLEALVAEADATDGAAPTLLGLLFDNLCRTMFRLGQADEWALGSPAAAWAADWVAATDATRLTPARLTAVAPAAARLTLTRRIKAWSQRYETAMRLRSWLRARNHRRRTRRLVS
jgi:GT2 family glycosyltransferase/glycosyltransferase involved in cell wall biosynthesis